MLKKLFGLALVAVAASAVNMAIMAQYDSQQSDDTAEDATSLTNGTGEEGDQMRSCEDIDTADGDQMMSCEDIVDEGILQLNGGVANIPDEDSLDAATDEATEE